MNLLVNLPDHSERFGLGQIVHIVPVEVGHYVVVRDMEDTGLHVNLFRGVGNSYERCSAAYEGSDVVIRSYADTVSSVVVNNLSGAVIHSNVAATARVTSYLVEAKVARAKLVNVRSPIAKLVYKVILRATARGLLLRNLHAAHRIDPVGVAAAIKCYGTLGKGLLECGVRGFFGVRCPENTSCLLYQGSAELDCFGFSKFIHKANITAKGRRFNGIIYDMKGEQHDKSSEDGAVWLDSQGCQMMQDYEITNADCLEAMREMPDGCIDAIVTDPPYGLAFMGANWDHNVPSVAYWSECLRVAKPGAHLLCFGGTRTFHRLMCAIEDAGWEIRDTIMWVYGSGFPKSMDVGKAIDKAAGAERESMPNPLAAKQTKSTENAVTYGRTATPTIQPIPVTDEAAQWDGWGTCLKPAWEPIIVARKPLDGTVAHNVMTYGTGAINIDECRVPTDGETPKGSGGRSSRLSGDTRSGKAAGMFAAGSGNGGNVTPVAGRFPANLVHDGSQEVLELFPDSKGQQGKVAGNEPSRTGDNGIYGHYGQRNEFVPRGDSGSAARFFYCAKASKRDRGEGNDHPTVKPNALMRWLVRLVCPQGGTVLDPFMGSGSTGVACIQEGMRFVGIEMDEHYCEIANTRILKETDNVSTTLF